MHINPDDLEYHLSDVTAPTLRELPRPLLAVLAAVLMFGALEVLLQWRSYLRTGQSIFSKVQGGSTYVRDPELGFNLLRPSHSSGGKQQRIISNSWGFRSPEIPEAKPPGTLRIVVLGASTVMGAYAPTNDDTFPARLQSLLRERIFDRPIDVINAGVVGLSIQEQRRFFEHRVVRFEPDITIVYTGFNDFAGYCRRVSREQHQATRPLVVIGMPAWLLSIELLLKNTVQMRTLPEGLSPIVRVESLDIEPYRQSVQVLLQTLKASGTSPLIARNARSYRRDQSLEEQRRLSGTARFYNPCFDLDGLHQLYERHNDVISEVGGALGVPVLPLDEVLPGGEKYFADASHFSAMGEQVVATWLADRLEPLLRAIPGGAR
ncbi:MAG: SGNH/GDSL hydrolase family protein [Rubrivivax sp.]